MAKTELTKRIEARLSTYRPKTLGDYKLNYMRDHYDMYEVPVTHGAVHNGLIDYVWLAEGFKNIRHEDICRAPYYIKNGWFSGDTNCIYSAADFTQMLESEIPVDDTVCSGCRYKSYRILQDDTPAIICFEIKVSKTDFHSSHGHNFVGNLNYYVMPLELYKEVADEIPPEIGCITYSTSDKQDTLRKRKDSVWRDIEHNLYTSMLLTCMNKYRKKWTEEVREQRSLNDVHYGIIESLVRENTRLNREVSQKPSCFISTKITDLMIKYPEFYKMEMTQCDAAESCDSCKSCIFSSNYTNYYMHTLNL